MLRGLVLLFLFTMFVVVLSPEGAAVGRKGFVPAQPDGRFVAQLPTPTPPPGPHLLVLREFTHA